MILCMKIWQILIMILSRHIIFKNFFTNSSVIIIFLVDAQQQTSRDGFNMKTSKLRENNSTMKVLRGLILKRLASTSYNEIYIQ